ncbi:MAG: hypothetical protein WDN72_00355 [Alphaproteobacteria bacterium]
MSPKPPAPAATTPSPKDAAPPNNDDGTPNTTPILTVGDTPYDLSQGADRDAGIAQSRLMLKALPPKFQQDAHQLAGFIQHFSTTLDDLPPELVKAEGWNRLSDMLQSGGGYLDGSKISPEMKTWLEGAGGALLRSTGTFKGFKGAIDTANTVTDAGGALWTGALFGPRLLGVIAERYHEHASSVDPMNADQALAVATAYEASIYCYTVKGAPDAPEIGFLDKAGAFSEHTLSWLIHFIADTLHMPEVAAFLMAIPKYIVNGFDDWHGVYADAAKQLKSEGHHAVSYDALLKDSAAATVMPQADLDARNGPLSSLDRYAGVELKPILDSLGTSTAAVMDDGSIVTTPGAGGKPDITKPAVKPNNKKLKVDEVHDATGVGALLDELVTVPPGHSLPVGGAIVVGKVALGLGSAYTAFAAVSRLPMSLLKRTNNAVVGARAGYLRAKANAFYNFESAESAANTARWNAETGNKLVERATGIKRIFSGWDEFRAFKLSLSPEARDRIQEAGDEAYTKAYDEKIAELDARGGARVAQNRAVAERLRASAAELESVGRRVNVVLEAGSLPVPGEATFRRNPNSWNERSSWRIRTSGARAPSETATGRISNVLSWVPGRVIGAVDRRLRGIGRVTYDLTAERYINNAERDADALRHGSSEEYETFREIRDEVDALKAQRAELQGRVSTASGSTKANLDQQIKDIDARLNKADGIFGNKPALNGQLRDAKNALDAAMKAHPPTPEDLARASFLDRTALNFRLAAKEGPASLARAIAHPDEHAALGRALKLLPRVGGVPANIAGGAPLEAALAPAPAPAPSAASPARSIKVRLGDAVDGALRTFHGTVSNVQDWGRWVTGRPAPKAASLSSGVPTDNPAPNDVIYVNHNAPAADGAHRKPWSQPRITGKTPVKDSGYAGDPNQFKPAPSAKATPAPKPAPGNAHGTPNASPNGTAQTNAPSGNHPGPQANTPPQGKVPPQTNPAPQGDPAPAPAAGSDAAEIAEVAEVGRIGALSRSVSVGGKALGVFGVLFTAGTGAFMRARREAKNGGSLLDVYEAEVTGLVYDSPSDTGLATWIGLRDWKNGDWKRGLAVTGQTVSFGMIPIPTWIDGNRFGDKIGTIWHTRAKEIADIGKLIPAGKPQPQGNLYLNRVMELKALQARGVKEVTLDSGPIDSVPIIGPLVGLGKGAAGLASDAWSSITGGTPSAPEEDWHGRVVGTGPAYDGHGGHGKPSKKSIPIAEAINANIALYMANDNGSLADARRLHPDPKSFCAADPDFLKHLGEPAAHAAPAKPPVTTSQLASVHVNLATPIRSEVAGTVLLDDKAHPRTPAQVNGDHIMAAATDAAVRAQLAAKHHGGPIVLTHSRVTVGSLVPPDTKGGKLPPTDPRAYEPIHHNA